MKAESKEKKEQKTKKRLVGVLDVIHPFLLAIFPILFLYATNIEETGFKEAFFPMLLSLAVAAVLFTALSLVTRNRYKAALIVSLFMVLFFTFGRIADGVPGLSRYRWALFIVYLVLFAAGVFGILKTKKEMVKPNKVISVFAAVLVVISLINVGGFYLRRPNEKKTGRDVKAGSYEGERPDIYYIILDAYMRDDMLRSFYAYDNSEFIDYLEDKGFYVADESSSNYMKTILSVPSSLNYDYLPIAGENPMRIDGATALDMVKDNRISQVLSERGYNIVQFGNAYHVTSCNDYADLVLSHADVNGSEFVTTLLNSTILSAFSQFKPENNVTNTFDILPKIKNMIEGPRFVFAHVICPHPPFIFDRNGELPEPVQYFDVGPKTRDKMYVDQLIYLNKKVKEVVDALLSQEKKPIIIIQSDHGMWFHSMTGNVSRKIDQVKEHTSILNAFYFPDGSGEDLLYESITPVNSFRVVLNNFFGENLPLLEDKVYTSAGKEEGQIGIYLTTRNINKVTSGLEEIMGFLKLETVKHPVAVYLNHLRSVVEEARFRERYGENKNIGFSYCEFWPKKPFPEELTKSAQKLPTYVVWSGIGPNPQIPAGWPLKLLKQFHDESDPARDLYLYEVTTGTGK